MRCSTGATRPRVLDALARAGLVLPVDRTGERYRYNRLVRDALRDELRQREPELEPELHRRASAWHRAAGDVERSVHHALGGRRRARRPPTSCGPTSRRIGSHGQTGALERWLEPLHRGSGLSPASARAHDRRLRAGARPGPSGRALGIGCRGRAVAAREPRHDRGGRRADARRDRGRRPGPDARRRGMGTRAPAGRRRLPRARVLPRRRGEPPPRRARRGDAAARGGRARARRSAHPTCTRCASPSSRCWRSNERIGTRRASSARRARAQVDRHALATSPTSALVFAVSAVARAHRGRIEEAQRDLADATQLQAALTDFADLVRGRGAHPARPGGAPAQRRGRRPRPRERGGARAQARAGGGRAPAAARRDARHSSRRSRRPRARSPTP